MDFKFKVMKHFHDEVAEKTMPAKSKPPGLLISSIRVLPWKTKP